MDGWTTATYSLITWKMMFAEFVPGQHRFWMTRNALTWLSGICISYIQYIISILFHPSWLLRTVIIICMTPCHEERTHLRTDRLEKCSKIKAALMSQAMLRILTLYNLDRYKVMPKWCLAPSPDPMIDWIPTVQKCLLWKARNAQQVRFHSTLPDQ